MLEHVGGDDDVERVVAERLVDVEQVEVGDDDPLGELLGDLAAASASISMPTIVQPLLLQHLGRRAGGAAELEHPLALADQAHDQAVGVVLVRRGRRSVS